MIELNEQQRQELAGQELALAHDPKTDEIYVLLRKAVFDRLQTLVGEKTACATADRLDRVLTEDVASDPHLAERRKEYGAARSGVGFRRTEGALADDPYWDAIMEAIYQERKQDARREIAE